MMGARAAWKKGRYMYLNGETGSDVPASAELFFLPHPISSATVRIWVRRCRLDGKLLELRAS